jgi:membrane protein implicated in regulation of membrane protease activity
MTDRPVNSPPSTRFAWVLDLADVLAVILAGVVLVVLSLSGLITSVPDLASAIMAVLAVVAVAILRDRVTRKKADAQLAEVHSDLAETRRSLNALKLGRPYHVVLHDTTWDLVAKDGSLAYVTRIKKLVFDQPDVVALYDFVQGTGTREYDYTVGRVVDEELVVEGKKARLISLGRVYSRGDVLDFGLKRTTRNAFMGHREYVSVVTRDLTAKLRLAVKWPVGGGPKTVRLVTITADRESSTKDVSGDVVMREGRHFYEYEVDEPEKGATTMIEWNW